MFLQIQQLQLEPIRFEETHQPGVIDFFDPQLRQVAPLAASGRAELSEALMEIRVRGHVSTTMEVACDRCLELAHLPIDTDFDLVYRPAAYSPPGDEVNITGTETEVGFYEGEGLELTDVLREQVLLSIPMLRVCREDCKGICPVCGQNRNAAQCQCHAVASDDRWADLKNL
ncbi:MAG TPA: DUF177 domain-containing protein [Bryobacteraceae bacterium]|nr:DUF177 domain-containing protein [Bryobacteraceae bacterium]